MGGTECRCLHHNNESRCMVPRFAHPSGDFLDLVLGGEE